MVWSQELKRSFGCNVKSQWPRMQVVSLYLICPWVSPGYPCWNLQAFLCKCYAYVVRRWTQFQIFWLFRLRCQVNTLGSWSKVYSSTSQKSCAYKHEIIVSYGEIKSAKSNVTRIIYIFFIYYSINMKSVTNMYIFDSLL